MLLDVLAAVVAATATATRATSSGGFVGLGGGGQGCGQKRDSMAAIADLLVATSGGRTRPHYGRCFFDDFRFWGYGKFPRLISYRKIGLGLVFEICQSCLKLIKRYSFV